MPLHPYTTFFGIHMTTKFVIATLTAHVIFGIVLGLLAHALDAKMAAVAGRFVEIEPTSACPAIF